MPPTRREQLELDELLSDIYRGIETLPDSRVHHTTVSHNRHYTTRVPPPAQQQQVQRRQQQVHHERVHHEEQEEPDEEEPDDEDDDEESETINKFAASIHWYPHHVKGYPGDYSTGSPRRVRIVEKELNERQVKEKAMIEELKHSLKNGAITLRQSLKGKKNTNTLGAHPTGRSSKTQDDHLHSRANSSSHYNKHSSVFSSGLATTPRHHHTTSNKVPIRSALSPRNQTQPEPRQQMVNSKNMNLLSNSPPSYNPSPMTPTQHLRAASPSLSPSPSPARSPCRPQNSEYSSKTLGSISQTEQRSSILRGTRIIPAPSQPQKTQPQPQSYLHQMQQPSQPQVQKQQQQQPNQPVYATAHASLMQHRSEQQANRPSGNPSIREFNELDSLLRSLSSNSSSTTTTHVTPAITNKPVQSTLGYGQVPAPSSDVKPQCANDILPSMEDYQNISKLNPVKNSFWYKPNMTRDRAIELLKDKPQGTFIVRDSTSFKNAYGLAVKVSKVPDNVLNKGDPSSELIRHFLIEPTPSGVRLKGYPNEPVFSNLASLIYQHSLTELALPCKLIIPRADIEDPKFNLKQKQFYDEFLASKELAKHLPYERTSPNGGYRKYPGDVLIHNEHRIIFE